MYSFNSRIRFSEVNSEKLLTLPSLLDYLQDSCTFQSEDLGVGMDYLEQSHAAWMLSSWQISISRYPEMGEKVTVNTWPYFFKGFYGYRNFTLKDENGKILAGANSIWVFMDTDHMRPSRVPDDLQMVYTEEFGDPLPGEWGDRKVPAPKAGDRMNPVQVARFHIDTNHHVNNGKYVLVAEEFLPEGFEIGGLRVEYKKAAVLGDILYPCVRAAEQAVTVALTDEAGVPYAVMEFIRK